MHFYKNEIIKYVLIFDLVSSTPHNYFEVYLCYSLYQYFILSCCSVVSSVWTQFSFIYPLVNIWVVFSLRTINKAAVNIYVYIFCIDIYFYVFLGNSLGIEWLVHIVGTFLAF